MAEGTRTRDNTMQQLQAAIAEAIARIRAIPGFGGAIAERSEVLGLDVPELAVKSQELEDRDPMTFQKVSQQTFLR